MSAPDPKAWTLTFNERCTISSKDDAEGVIASVARRRAIEELKALAKVMCSDCGKGVEFTVHPFEPKTYFHNGEDLGYWECQCPEIHDRIAAIESEEA